MDKRKLERNKVNKRELAMIDRQIENLHESLNNVPVVSGKVTASGREFPYIEQHITVKMAEPKEATAIKSQIREKEIRKKRLQEEMQVVEAFVDGMPEGEEKRIFELTYVEGMTQKEVADLIGYTQGRVSQLINKFLKD